MSVRPNEVETLLRALCTDAAYGWISHASLLRHLTRLVCERFACSHVLLWRFARGGGGREIRCVHRYCHRAGHSTPDLAVSERQFGEHFEALDRQGLRVCDAVADHPAMAALTHHLSMPHVRSTMDAVLALNGAAIGVLTCAQEGRPRQWTPEEVADLQRYAMTARIPFRALCEQ
jgi:GAF domain-containing protein